MQTDRLNVKGLALGIGVLWAFYITLVGWGSAFGWGTNFVGAFSNLYIGYGPGFISGLIGGVWAFFDGAIAGIIIASVYNWVLVRKRSRR